MKNRVIHRLKAYFKVINNSYPQYPQFLGCFSKKIVKNLTPYFTHKNRFTKINGK